MSHIDNPLPSHRICGVVVRRCTFWMLLGSGLFLVCCSKLKKTTDEGTDPSISMDSESDSIVGSAYYSLSFEKVPGQTEMTTSLSVVAFEKQVTCAPGLYDLLKEGNNHSLHINSNTSGNYEMIPADLFSILDERLLSGTESALFQYWQSESNPDSVDYGQRPDSGRVVVQMDSEISIQTWKDVADARAEIDIEINAQVAESYIYALECNDVFSVEGELLESLCDCVNANGETFSCEPKNEYDNCCMKGEHATREMNLRYKALPCGYLCTGTEAEFNTYCTALFQYEEQGVWAVGDSDVETCRDCEQGDMENVFFQIRNASTQKSLLSSDYSLEIKSLADGLWRNFKAACQDVDGKINANNSFNCSSTFGASPLHLRLTYLDDREFEVSIDTRATPKCLGKHVVYFTIDVPKTPSEIITASSPEYFSACDINFQ